MVARGFCDSHSLCCHPHNGLLPSKFLFNAPQITTITLSNTSLNDTVQKRKSRGGAVFLPGPSFSIKARTFPEVPETIQKVSSHVLWECVIPPSLSQILAKDDCLAQTSQPFTSWSYRGAGLLGTHFSFSDHSCNIIGILFTKKGMTVR